MTNGNKNIIFSFQLPKELMQQIECKAKSQMISTAALIRLAMQQYLKKND